MGFGLAQAQRWLAERSDDIPEADRTFIFREPQGGAAAHAAVVKRGKPF